MLSKAGGTTFQRVVPKVSDLPSPLDAHADETYIVRETEEVYRFDQATRTWQMIGTLKKVGGKKPAEISEHLDSKANPHEVALTHVYEAGATVVLNEDAGEITLEHKGGSLKALLRLLSLGGQGIRFGADAGTSNALLWVNGGCANQKKPVLRVVNDKGEDQFLLDSDGNLKVLGTVELPGGVKGQTVFGGGIFAMGGINGGESLLLTGKRVSLFAEKLKTILTDKGLGIGTEPTEALDVAGNLKIGGTVSSDLNPSDALSSTLGQLKRRWKSVAAGLLDLTAGPSETALKIKAAPGQTAPVLLIDGDASMLALTGDGNLGLGTATPERTLDVRGSGIAIGAPVGKARSAITDTDGDVRFVFNVKPDGTPEDDDLYSWCVALGSGRRDAIEVMRRAKNGAWRPLFGITDKVARIGVPLEVDGAIKANVLKANALGNTSESAAIVLDPTGQRISYVASTASGDGAVHEFRGVWKSGKTCGGVLVDMKDAGASDASTLMLLRLNGEDRLSLTKAGHLLPGDLEQTLGAADAPWNAAYLTRGAVVMKTLYADGKIESDGAFELRAKKPISFNQSLYFSGTGPAIVYPGEAGVMAVAGEGTRSVLFDVREDSYGIDFPVGGARISGVGELALEALSVSSKWGKGVQNALSVAITDGVSASESTLANFSLNGKDVLSLYKDELVLNAPMTVNGLQHAKLEAILDVAGLDKAMTPFSVPAGVRIEAVVVKILTGLEGVRFWQIGDAATADRFASATAKLAAGSVVKGLNHCDRGQSVQTVDAPVVISFDAAAQAGKLLVQVHYLNPEAT